MPENPSDSLLRFDCVRCGVGLTVDVSLAGIEGPCPRCGENLKAPQKPVASSPEVAGNQGLTTGVTRGVRNRRSEERSPRVQIPETRTRPPASVPAAHPVSLEDGSRRRSFSRPRLPAMTPAERAEMHSVLKVFLAIALGIFVFVTVAWYLRS